LAQDEGCNSRIDNALATITTAFAVPRRIGGDQTAM
jgi:hypothetical protein